MPYGVIPPGAIVLERLHGAEVGWYETTYDEKCSCCGEKANRQHAGLASDEDGPVHFCDVCVEKA